MSEPIRLMHYDPRWRQEFEQTRSSLLHGCAGLVVDVRHVGSTAIPGLVARPIIDCVATLADPSGFDEAALLIEGLNFSLQKRPNWLPDGRFLAKPRWRTATHHVYLVPAESLHRQQMIALRDRFLADPERAVQFEEAKIALWRETAGDPAAYALAKQALFATLASG